MTVNGQNGLSQDGYGGEYGGSEEWCQNCINGTAGPCIHIETGECTAPIPCDSTYYTECAKPTHTTITSTTSSTISSSTMSTTSATLTSTTSVTSTSITSVTLTSTTVTEQPEKKKKSSMSAGDIVGIVIGTICVAGLVGIVVYKKMIGTSENIEYRELKTNKPENKKPISDFLV